MTEPSAEKLKLAHIGSGSLIIRTAALVVVPLQLVFSLFLLLRGHDEPGGGFIGGLVASGALALYLYACGVHALNKLLRIYPKDLLAAGLLLGLLATVPSLFLGDAFFTAQWLPIDLGGHVVKLSTVLLFDIGVYLTVVGTMVIIFTALAEIQLDED